MADLQTILRHFTGVKPDGRRYRADCPCPHHSKDNNGHLMISENDDGKIGIHCFAGCYTDEVINEVGLKFRDLFPPTTENDRRRFSEMKAEKLQKQAVDTKAHKLWCEIQVISQALQARLFDKDGHPANMTERWDREKQAVRLLPKLMRDYYGN